MYTRAFELASMVLGPTTRVAVRGLDSALRQPGWCVMARRPVVRSDPKPADSFPALVLVDRGIELWSTLLLERPSVVRGHHKDCWPSDEGNRP
jgi:hypothetical protein